MPYVRPFRACARAVKAFVSILNVLRCKLTYYAYKKENKRGSSWEVVFITKTNSEGLDENVHLCSRISVIKSCTQKYECDSMHTLRSAKPFKNNPPKNTVCMMIDNRCMA